MRPSHFNIIIDIDIDINLGCHDQGSTTCVPIQYNSFLIEKANENQSIINRSSFDNHLTIKAKAKAKANQTNSNQIMKTPTTRSSSASVLLIVILNFLWRGHSSSIQAFSPASKNIASVRLQVQVRGSKQQYHRILSLQASNSDPTNGEESRRMPPTGSSVDEQEQMQASDFRTTTEASSEAHPTASDQNAGGNNNNMEERLQTPLLAVEQRSAMTYEQRAAPSIDYDGAYVLFASAFIGVLSGFAVALFKLSIEGVREAAYGTSLLEHFPVFLIPALGGVGVSILAYFGEFSPGLRGTAKEIDSLSINSATDERFTKAGRFLRKPLAAIFTLGTGSSLGPEGPSVEVGMTISRICMPPSVGRGGTGRETDVATAARIRRNRLLLSAGAAAGVSAGFNAPLAGVFFALEIVQQSLPPLVPVGSTMSTVTSDNDDDNDDSTNQETKWFQQAQDEYLSSGTDSITAILLASVLSALVSQVYLGDSLALSVPSYQLKTPLVELPLYLLLGAVSGVVAGIFTAMAQFSKGVFDGEVGPVVVQDTMKILPKWTKPIIGGLICGLVGLVYPQILFFGYETLNTLLGEKTLPTDLILTLLAVKIFTTAVAAGSGLVGGTFAPSLFLGGMVGASFHNIIAQMFLVAKESPFEVADVQAYAIVGAAGVLAALFRAPLTSSLLLFELTRDYDVLLPVLASAGVGSVIGDIVENAFEEKRRDRDAVSWGDLSDEDEDEFPAGKRAKT
jgi:H+/Cl- antiporter ClcA